MVKPYCTALLLLCLALLPAGGQLAPGLAWAGAQAAGAVTTSDVQPADAPMTVAIVESNAPGCRPRCPRWIAASGQITGDTPALFRKVLQQAGRLKLPVLLHSPGGSVDAAIEIGRMLRRAGFDTAVALTSYAGCAPGAKACKLPPAQRGVYRGAAREEAGYCASACPLILAGGVSRYAQASSYVGVHQFRTTWTRERIRYRDTLRIANGRKTISRKVVSRQVSQYDSYGIDGPTRKKVAAYLSQMGVSAVLVTEMEKAPFTALNRLLPSRMMELNLINARQGVGTRLDPAVCRAPLPARNCPDASMTSLPRGRDPAYGGAKREHPWT